MTERDFFIIIRCGPRGVKWLHFDAVIDENNPLMFTCGVCRKTTGSYPFDPDNKLHEPRCKNELMNKLGM